jgi:hypothetical protein
MHNRPAAESRRNLGRAAELRRELGMWSAVAIVVGTVIGSGIFLVPKTMILRVGSVDRRRTALPGGSAHLCRARRSDA